LVACNDDHVWKLFILKVLKGAISIKTLLLKDFGNRVHYERLKNGFEELMIPLHGYKMATNLGTSMDRSSYKESRNV
jgi:hypothetical protein